MLIELSFRLCMAGAACHTVIVDHLYPSMEYCEDAGNKTYDHARADLDETNFVVVGFTCRLMEDNRRGP